MGPVTDPTAIAFCNDMLRPIMDRYAQLYHQSLAVIAEWTARGGTDFIAADAGDIMDGADVDGRPVIDGPAVVNAMTRLNELEADMSADSFAKLNTILAVAVHATAT